VRGVHVGSNQHCVLRVDFRLPPSWLCVFEPKDLEPPEPRDLQPLATQKPGGGGCWQGVMCGSACTAWAFQVHFSCR
jgi:hypothetical protein